ncbi:sensor histidine kinase KdpD [Streptomyces sp. MUM 16J]|uniref:sensor histidine kinase n=1 Tax=Streptomyces sp. MUM 16J TaxID=2791988 RepID=UPI001F0447C8|nr:HAMP domain-containing sensor histidine kinase [Streptomyces sp. MUM 16J]MCH0556805.1 HAMP domain-containing histidine kinase [Streptomyces sp. MUM 16J]
MKSVLRRLAPRTLRGRLSLAAVATAALLMTVLTVVFHVMVDRHLRHQADDELRRRAAVAAATVDTRGPRVRILETPNDQLLDANTWIYTGADLIEKPPSTTTHSPLTRAAERLAAQQRHACTTVGTARRHSVRLCSQPLHGDRTVTVVTALDLAPYRGSADTLLLGSLVLDAAMLVCTYALTRLAVSRALRPVRTMTDQATQRGAVACTERFDTEGLPAELARLGISLDALLDRVRTVLRHEQQLTGELSHELRTPLTRIIIELDWWRARPRTDEETRATHEVISEAAQSMRTICDTLLHQAREGAQDPSAAPGTTDVATVLERLLQRLDPSGPVLTVLEAEEPGLEAGAGSALLERIVSPLLSNAVRYARSSVTVSARRDADAVRIHVTDDGPGVPQAFLDELFHPGRRADSGDGHDGAGLGLALARRLARSVGGEVSYDAGHAPGARFTVSLPAG